MDEKEQIEEMARSLLLKHHGIECFCNCTVCGKCSTYYYAETLYNEGYRKQIESEWIFHEDGSATCKHCGTTQKCVWDMDNFQAYCGHCGAHMKGF